MQSRARAFNPHTRHRCARAPCKGASKAARSGGSSASATPRRTPIAVQPSSANTTQTTVSVLKSATVPLWSPSILIRNLLVAALLGLLLGIARALLAERRDRRLRTIDDVVRVLQQPLLLALPDGYARGRDRRSEQTRRRLVAPYPRLAAPRPGAQT